MKKVLSAFIGVHPRPELESLIPDNL
jgi:hypothetical protein